LQALLQPFGITKFSTDGWGAYERYLDAEQHHVGKENTQKIESKHINLRTRIKRLVRRTICFSKTERMHDLVIGLFINRYEFGRPLSSRINTFETPSFFNRRVPSLTTCLL
jgi:insertion element IS1 protein InsB